MASIGHIAVGLAAGRAFRSPRPGRAMVAFSLLSVWPDVDVIAFGLGIPYDDPFGHRGATHSLAAAGVVALAAFLLAKPLGLPRARTVLFTLVVAASHGLLDTLTYGGGLGVELFWPLSTARFWAPVRFIPIAPIGVGMFSMRGLWVVAVELIEFAPFWLYASWPRRGRVAAKTG